MRYTIRHIFNTDADTFWDKIFFDPEYNAALFEGHLRFKAYRVLELERKDDGSVYRRAESTPGVELPAVAKKVLGDATTYVEEGRFDPVSRRFTVDVKLKLSKGADKIKTHIAMWVEPRGDKRIERIVEVDNQVKVFGIGGMVEGFVEKQTRASYDQAAEFTNRWIAEKGL